MAEVEAHALAIHHLTFLGHVGAKDVLEGGVEQVGGRMVQAGARPALGVDRENNACAETQRARGQANLVDMKITSLLTDIGDLGGAAVPAELAAIAGLSAALGIERRAIKQHVDRLPGMRLDNLRPAFDDRQHVGFGAIGLVANEFRRPQSLAKLEPNALLNLLARPAPAFTGHRPLVIHGRLEAFQVDGDSLDAHRVRRQIQGKAVGVVKLERGLAG